MKRRDFLKITGLSAGYMLIPGSSMIKAAPGQSTIFDEFWARTRWMPLSYQRTELNGVVYNAPKMQVRAPMQYSEEELMHEVKYQFLSRMIHGEKGFPSYGILPVKGMKEILERFPTTDDQIWPVITLFRTGRVEPIKELSTPGYQYANIAGFVTMDTTIKAYPLFNG